MANRIQDLATGAWVTKFPIQRNSWPCACKEISSPAQINSSALNKACITMWNIAMLGSPKPIAVIIIPSCLSVDSAIIFFMSHSVVALIPAISIVHTAINRMVKLKAFSVDRNG